MIENVSCSGENFVELVEHDVRIGVALQFDDDADRFFEIALVANVGDALDLVLRCRGRRSSSITASRVAGRESRE
jgi:hypothetical protein